MLVHVDYELHQYPGRFEVDGLHIFPVILILPQQAARLGKHRNIRAFRPQSEMGHSEEINYF